MTNLIGKQGRTAEHASFTKAVQRSPGKSTLVNAAYGDAARATSAETAPVQRKGGGGDTEGVHVAADAGIAGPGGPLPFKDRIQSLFGAHDVSGVRAHTGTEAAAANTSLGSIAYAKGDNIAFAGTPDLHTAAHEAAHVVQQRGGVQLSGGVGRAGDAYEQHADTVADAVVQGKSAEGLLDAHGQGSGSGGVAGAQRQAVQRQPVDPTKPVPASPVDAKPIIARLDRMSPRVRGILPLFAGIDKGRFDIDNMTVWMDDFAQLIGEAATVLASPTPPTDLVQAFDNCVQRNVPPLQLAAEQVRAATVQLTNDSSVTKKDPAAVVFPAQAQVAKFAGAAATLDRLTRYLAPPSGEAARTTLQIASATAQDAALAMLQSLSVVSARDRWKKGSSTETPTSEKAGKGARHEIDEVYKDSGWGDRADGSSEWCGMFAVSSLFKGAGLARQLRSGFYDVRNVKDFFRYEQKTNPDRAPMAIWADDRWWTLKDYHAARGSMRQWIERATIQAALMSGGSGDIRPGDTCLVDHRGGDNPIHIVMVESYDTTTKQLVTIEGNSHGIRAERDGKPERVDGDHFKEAKQDGPSASVVNVRNLRDLGPPPGPGTYLVTSPETFVRDDDHLGQIKMDHGKKVSIAANTTVEVTEAKDVGGTRFAKVDRLGWTLFSNLGTETVVEGGYRANRGTTVWGVGRPSIVDFEDGHEYAVHPVPATLQTTSPERMRELAKHKDKEGAAARGVTFAK